MHVGLRAVYTEQTGWIGWANKHWVWGRNLAQGDGRTGGDVVGIRCFCRQLERHVLGNQSGSG